MADVDTRSVIRLAGQGTQPGLPAPPARSYVVVAADPARGQPGAQPGDPEVDGEAVTLLRLEVDDAGGPGNLLTPLPASLEPPVHRRPAQLPTVPPASGGLIGRRPEILALRAALEPGAAVVLYGSPGVGKTTVVRQLATELEHERPVAMLDGRNASADDLLRLLFSAWYASDEPFRPGPATCRRYLAEVGGVVIIDDARLREDELRRLLGIAASCALVVTAERPLQRERAMRLAGLPPQGALALLARTCGRRLSTGERRPLRCAPPSGATPCGFSSSGRSPAMTAWTWPA